jgi:circadian clock protein KaiC
VELGETIKFVLAEAERIKPLRLVFDAVSDLRLLAENAFRYRRQILALKQYFSRQQCTVIVVDDRSGERKDMELHSLVHGVIGLLRQTSDYGAMRRRLQITKMRGQAFHEGFHDVIIKTGGLELFPRLVPGHQPVATDSREITSGLEGFDALLGGGLPAATTTLLLGTAGTGKSSIASQFACSAAAQGRRVAFFLFDEAVGSFLARSAGLGMPMEGLIEKGMISARHVDPAELSPGEFAHQVRRAVEQDGTRMVVIDSLTGYMNAMPSERYLMLHLHELAIFLGERGVNTILIMNQSGIIGSLMQAPIDVSYLADTVILLRYFEARGEVRKALSVIKKRTGNHEKTIRELRFENGIKVGEPVREFQGVLSGQPELVGAPTEPEIVER